MSEGQATVLQHWLKAPWVLAAICALLFGLAPEAKAETGISVCYSTTAGSPCTDWAFTPAAACNLYGEVYKANATPESPWVIVAINSSTPGGSGYCALDYQIKNNSTGQIIHDYLNGSGFVKYITVANVIDVPRAFNPPRGDPCRGDPIYPMRGVLREDVSLGIGLAGIDFQLTYDSTPLTPQVAQGIASPGEYVTKSASGVVAGPGPIGPMWSMNLFKSLSIPTAGDVSVKPAAIVASRGTGATIAMGRDAGGAFTSEPDVTDKIVAVSGGGYRYLDQRSLTEETYDSAGSLVSIHRIDGLSVTLSKSGGNTVVTDAFGRAVSLNMTAVPLWGCSGGGYTATGTHATAALACAAWSSQLGGSGCTPIGATAFKCSDSGGALWSVSANQGSTRSMLTSITDAAGQSIVLTADPTTGSLGSITWQDGTSRKFVYENNVVGALTGITDERDARASTFTYDTNWRAVGTQRALGADNYTVSYTKPPSIIITETYDSSTNTATRYFDWDLPQGIAVTNPLGSQSAWIGSSIINKNYLSSQSQAAGSGCAASSSAIAYDANANVASRDDFSDRRVCYVSDLNRNLETARVEGLANTVACSSVTAVSASLPSGSRKTSTQWHPDWRLEAKVAAPGRITTRVYNGQPDPFNGNAVANCAPATALLPDGKPIVVLCKTVEQSTTDTDGHLGFGATVQSGVAARVSSWIYNQYGQVLTAKGPRTAVNDTTTYTYYTDTTADHTVGDLKTTTNSLGKVTSYDKYNKPGQLLQSTDPNGNVTVNTYDTRQRLLTRSMVGEVTTYAYDPVGQLMQVTQADGSWVAYEYDDAHRQKAVKDNLGNRIEYQLDNTGSKTGESVKDPVGSLKRSLSRVMDALGRTQQSTGRSE